MAKRLERIVSIAGVALVGAAVVTELRKPKSEQTWHGRVGGVVPYDLRPPTWKRVHNTLWNPDNRKLVVPHAFGVGWTLNLGRLSPGRRGASAGGRPR
jgi:Family of unknown function (DUF5808)